MNTGRMCAKMSSSSTICYPMLADYDYTKGDNDNYYGCPVDMLACVAETAAPTAAPTAVAPTDAPTDASIDHPSCSAACSRTSSPVCCVTFCCSACTVSGFPLPGCTIGGDLP